MSAISTATRLVCKKICEELSLQFVDTTEDLILVLKDKLESSGRLSQARGLFQLADQLNIQLDFDRNADEYSVYDIEKIQSMIANSLMNRVNNILNNVVRNGDSYRIQALYEVTEALGINPTTIDLTPESISRAVGMFRGPIA